MSVRQPTKKELEDELIRALVAVIDREVKRLLSTRDVIQVTLDYSQLATTIDYDLLAAAMERRGPKEKAA